MPLSPQDQDNLYKLWSTVNKDYELPDFETFKADMQDTTNRRKLWETVAADYELPDYDTFQSDMGFDVSTPQVKDEKKKNIQPKAEAGGGFSAGLDRQYLDHFVTATETASQYDGGKYFDVIKQQDAYFAALKKNMKFSDEQINYIREQYKSKKQQAAAAEGKELTGGVGRIGEKPKEEKEWKGDAGKIGKKPDIAKSVTPPFDLGQFNTVMERQNKLASGEMTSDAYAEEIKREADDAFVAYQKKVREESANFYINNADNYDDKFGGLYLAYLKEKNPERFSQIQNQIATGNWDKGADPAKKVVLEQLGKEYRLPFLGQAYEIYANIIGENNLENTAQLYKEALNWKAESENAAYEKISKNPLMQQTKVLQDQQKQLSNTQAGQVLLSSSTAIEQLSKTPEVQEFVALGEKGAANGNKLQGADWDRYQELKTNPGVVKYAQSIQQYQQAAQTPEGQKFAAINQELQKLYNTPDFQQLAAASDVLARNSANTKKLVESYTQKFPGQAFAEAYYKAEQQKVDAFYKRMSPVLRTFANIATTLNRVPMAITGEILAGATRAAAGIGALAGGEETLAGAEAMYDLNGAADLITSVAEGLNSNMFPQPTNLQLPMFDQYAPYNGYRVYTNKRNEVIDVRDADGYAVDEKKMAMVANQWEYETNRPAKVNAVNTHMILPKITQTVADLMVLAMAPEAGALVNLGHKGSMITYGYLTNYNTAYEEIKAADPFISESAAHLYANTKGIMMGGLLTLTPKTLFPGKDGELVWKEIGKEYTKILAGGTPAKKALFLSIGKVMGKEGLAMAGIGFAMDLSDRGLKLAANTLTNRPTQETEYTFNQALETGVSMFITGAVMVGMNKGFKGLRGDALYTGLKNYESTIGELEQMANRGDISQQDFARASGMLSQLKPIYDNLADMGKFNDAYKSSLIGLYADKLRVEEKLGKATTIEALQKGASPERDALVQELNQINAKIERLAIINNPEFIVYTESVKGTEQFEPRLQSIIDKILNYIKFIEKLNQGKNYVEREYSYREINWQLDKFKGILSESDLKYLSKQSFYIDEFNRFNLYPPERKVEIGNQYVYDSANKKFIAVSDAVGKEKPGITPDTQPGVEVIGVRVAMPEYFAEGQRVTRDQLLEMVKDPEFLSDLQAGRKTLSIFNDLEIQAYVERLMPRQKEPIGPERQVKEPGAKGLLGEATVKTIGDLPIRPIGGGPVGNIEVTETGIYFTDINGKSKQLAVADKNNPTETLSELGYEVVIQPKAPGPPAPVAVELLDDNVSFNIDGNKVTWLKFNYGNNGELQTADVLTPEGRKIKIKDRDVVYDMAVQLSNNSRTRLAIPKERVSEDIAEAVKPVKEGFDLGMKAIDTIFGDVDPVVEAVLEAVEMDIEVDADAHAAAELWLEDAIRRTEKIDTQNVEEKQRVVEWAKGLLGEIGTAKIAAKRPVQPELAAEGIGGQPAAEREPVAPTEQRIYEFPELPSRAKALVKRLAGTKGEAEAERIVTTIKEAYQAEKAPAEELAKIGYGKQEYVKAVGEVVEALKPTVKTVPVEALSIEPVVSASKQELVGMIEDGTVQDMIERGSLDMLTFMRMVDKYELPIPKWFQGMEETFAEEMGYTDEAQDAELLDLINKAYERSGIPLETQSRSINEGERLLEFKKGDVVFRDYGGKYEEYRIISDKGDLWKLENTETGKELTLNAVNNGGFVLKSEGKKWSATELSEKTPVEVMESLAELKPELAPMMKEAIEIHEKLKAIKTEGGGYIVTGSESNRKKYEVIPANLFPFPYRIYSQLFNARGADRAENARIAIDEFADKLKNAKQYLQRPPDTAELAQMRAEAEKFEEERIAKIKAEQEEARKRFKTPTSALEVYKYSVEQKKLYGDINELKTILNAGSINGRKLSDVEKSKLETKLKELETQLDASLKAAKTPEAAVLTRELTPLEKASLEGLNRLREAQGKEPMTEAEYGQQLAQGKQPAEVNEKITQDIVRMLEEGLDWNYIVGNLGVSPNSMEVFNAVKEIMSRGKYPSKKLPQSYKFDVEEFTKDVAKNVAPIPVGIRAKTFKSINNEVAELKWVVSDDILIPAFQAVYIDGDKGNIIATNQHALIVIGSDKAIGKESKLINPKTGNKVDEKAPNYYAVIPQSTEYNIEVSLPQLMAELNGISKAKQFFDGQIFAFFKYGPNAKDYIALNPDVALPYLKIMAAYGVDKVSLGVNKPNRPIMVYSDKGVTALIMPVMVETADGNIPDFGYKQILEINVQSGTTTNPIYQKRYDPIQGKISEPYERYASKSRDGGLLGFTANEPVANESKVGQSQEGPIDNDALATFVKAVGVNKDGTVKRRKGQHYGDIMAELANIPGNIEVYRDMANGGKPRSGNVFRFKIEGVPFNPVTYLKTGKIEGLKVEGQEVIEQRDLAQKSSDVGFTEKEINYRQSQFDFGDHPDTQTVDIKNDIPLRFRSVAEIIDESVELTGKELTDQLAESKLQRKLKEGEYIHKTSKISISKDWNIWRKTGEIKAPVDVAYMFRQLEDYNSEQMMLAMIDGDGKLHVAHVGTGSANAALANIQKIMDFVLSFNAKKFWWIHNHPSGALDTSEGDRLVNANINRAAASLNIDFQGGIVVNWDKSAYTYFDPYGNNVEYGKTYLDYPEAGASEQVPVYQNHIDSRNQSIPKNNFTGPQDVVRQISSMVTQTKAGEAVKGGVLLLNNQNRVIGHLFLNGHDDISTITKGVAATNAVALITYGTFTEPIVTVGGNYMDARVLDHIIVESNTFGKYDITSTAEPYVVFSTPANDIPNVRETTLPYGDKAPKLEKAVQKAMLDGFVTFDEVIFNLYTDFYQGDAAKIRQNLQKIKDAYDEVSLLDEFLDKPISSIEDVARFDLDKFLINVNRPQKTETSLRQQYNDFASWFEYNYPEYKFYYNIDIDPNNGQVYFRIGKDPVKMTNGNVLYYGDWISNKKWQREWNEKQKSEVFSRPPMVWVDKEITPTPYEHVKKDQYAIGEDQEFAVNLILDRFIPKTPGKEPKRGFMLGDGMGIGKTRIALGTANEMIKAKNLPVLIITKSASVVEQFQREAAALSLSNILYRQEPKNVNEPKIVVGTYEDLTRGKLGNADKYAVVVFDEAHMLKNKGAQRSMSAQEFLKKTEHVVFATGTPMDKPVQLAYFMQHMTGKDMDESLKPVGLYMDEGRLKKRPDAPDKPIKELFLMWRSNMIKEGAYLRREYPFFGSADRVYITFKREDAVMLERIKIGNGRNAVMAANRYQEHLKIPYILGETIKAVNEGKQVVIFCVGVNDTIIFPDGKKSGFGIEVPQFAKEFSRQLKEAGIDHATIYGADASAKLEESRKFQRGDVKVAIATISSGGTGIDLDDQIGDAPREVIFATLPWSGNEFDQAQFRVSRRNTKTPSRMRFLFAENSWADNHKEHLVNRKMETLRLIQAGKDPDLIDMERWREGADGGLIDIVEDDFNDQDENVSNPDDNQYVEAITAPPIEVTETPNEVKEKFDNGDPATLQAVGELPAPIGGEIEYVRVTAENQSNPEQEGTVEPTTPLGAPSTKGQPTTIGGAKSTPTVQQRRAWWKSFLFGPPKQKSLSTMVLEIYQKLGIPTRGEYHMNPKYLGYYSHVTKDVSLKVAADIFVALHEAIHWADFSKLGGITNQIINNNDVVIIKTLSAIHDKFYPGARKSAPVRTKVAEGLTMYMQMKLYDPDTIAPFYPVTNAVFTPGGQYYDPIWDDIFDAFENLKNTIAAMSPLMQASLTIADMNTPKSKDYTIDTWNFLAKRLFKNYDESIPLSLWDDKAGVGFGTAMERTDDKGKLIQSAQNAYFFFRNRNRLASNWVNYDPTFLNAFLPSNPMFYDTNGQWTAGEYRMADTINALKKLEKSNPDILTDDIWNNFKVDRNEAMDITKAYSTYLLMRRMFMDYQKRKDLETLMQVIIGDGMRDYLDLIHTSDPNLHAQRLGEFKSKHLEPFKEAFENWKKINELIGNEGGTYVELNEDFSPSLLAWSSPQFRNLHSKLYNPNLGNLKSDANATQVYQRFSQQFAEADKSFDYINQTMLRMMVATGMLSQENADKYVEDNTKYPGYASFQRYVSNTFFDDPELVQIIGSDNVGKIRSTLQRKGSSADIIDPVLSQAVMVHEVFRKGLKNLMWLRLANMSRTDEQLSRGLIPIPTRYVPQKNSKGETMYMKPVISGKADIPGQILIYADGVGKYYQIADESLLAFYNAITELDGGKWYSGIVNSRIYKAGVAAANMFTLMTTGVYPLWAIQNFTVDQLSAGMNSKLGTIPIYTSAKNFLPAFGLAVGNMVGKQLESFAIFQKMFPGKKPTPKQLEYITEFMSLGGSSQTMMAQLMSDEQKATVQNLFEIKPKGLLPKIKFGAKRIPKVVTWTVDFTSLPTNLSEVVARFSEYSQARDSGMSKEAAFRHSIETMPFAKRGASAMARFYFPLVSYLRSSFTVAAKTLEEAIDQPKKFATVWASVATAAAIAFINFWEGLEEDEKNYYLQADGTELAQYFIIPARFLGGPEHTMYRFRIPEIIGSASALGTLYGISMVTKKPAEYKQMAKAVAANIPSAVNPVEWAAGDTSIAASVMRQTVRLSPQATRPVFGLYSGKTPSTTGVRPITPRSLEFYPGEFQYRIGSRGTSSVVADISDKVTGKIGLTPIQTEYLLGEYFGRTGRFILDLVDEKDIKSAFIREREDYALRGRWYQDFYEKNTQMRARMTVINTIRDPKPSPKNVVMYEKWKDNLRSYAKEYTLYSAVDELLAEAYKVREHAVINDTTLPLFVYDKFDEMVKSFYDNEPYDVRKKKVNEAFSMLKDAARGVDYKNVRFFAPTPYSVKFTGSEITKFYNKLYKQ